MKPQSADREMPESGRIDINATPPELLARLMQAVGADEALARQIAAATADFRDADHESSPDGAEDPDYQALGKPDDDDARSAVSCCRAALVR